MSDTSYRSRRTKEMPEIKKPTVKPPGMKTLDYWMFDGVAEATDGCTTEPDGICEHGYPSWLLYLNLI